MKVVMEYEESLGKKVFDVHEKNLGYDITSLDITSSELRFIEVKGIGAESGTIILTSNERRVAKDRQDCFLLYVILLTAILNLSCNLQYSILLRIIGMR